MMMRVSGHMIQISNWELQGVSIPVMTMFTNTKALLTMTNMMKGHIMLQNLVSHWWIPRMDHMGVAIVLMRTM